MAISGPTGRVDWPMLPAKPLVDLMQRIIDRQQADNSEWRQRWPPGGVKGLDDICREFGISCRTWHRWRFGGQEAIQFAVVDRVLVNTDYHWWDLWPRDEFPEVWARIDALDRRAKREQDEAA